MKKTTLACMAIAMLATTSPLVYAQSQTTPTTQEQNSLLTVKVQTVNGQTVKAAFQNVTDEGKTQGISSILLTGTLTEVGKNPDGSKQISVVWNSITDTKGKVTESLNAALASQAKVKPGIEQGDTLAVKGNFQEVINAYLRMQKKGDAVAEKEEEKEEEDKEQAERQAAKGSASASRGAAASEEEYKPLNAEITAVAEKYEDFNCNPDVRVDEAAMQAIQQSRLMQEGREIEACSDTSRVYALTKDYTQCAFSEDVSTLTAAKQYVLTYTKDASSGVKTTATGCRVDRDTAVAMTPQFCGLQHDFTAGTSYRREELVYTLDNVTRTAQSCQNTATTYTHKKSSTGCPKTVETVNGVEKYVTSYYTYITVDGEDTTIQECTPDLTTAQDIQVENCTSPEFTHDFDGGISYRNKTYFVTNSNGTRTNIQGMTCVQSTEGFTHGQDIDTCGYSNDDANLVSYARYKIFIEPTAGDKVFITDCQQSSEAIPYVTNGSVWATGASFTQTLTLNSADTATATAGSTYIGANHGAHTLSESLGWELLPVIGMPYQSEVSTSRVFFKDNLNKRAYSVDYACQRSNTSLSNPRGSGPLTWQGQAACMRGSVTGGVSSAGVGVNLTLSNGQITPPAITITPPYQLPVVTKKTGECIGWNNHSCEGNSNILAPYSYEAIATGRRNAWNVQAPNLNLRDYERIYVARPDSSTACEIHPTMFTVNLTCASGFTCQVTDLYARPRYLRPDGSNYVNNATSTQFHKICGDGSHLNGQVVQ